MTKTNKSEIRKLNRVVTKTVSGFKPPEVMTVSQWADKKRRLSPETAAEPGPWRTERTPYLKEPMDAFTDPRVHKIVIVAASQVGKTELELNVIGYIIDQDPGTILLILPTLDDARKFSRQRLAPMIRDCKAIKNKVADVKSRDSNNTLLQKTFPGGSITLIGTNTASALASLPVRYVIGDEHDRWAQSAGEEGDPGKLAEARQRTFYNAKNIDISTPTVRGSSPIEKAYNKGTQEHYCHQCPECGEYSEIDFDNIKFEHKKTQIGGATSYAVFDPVFWVCPKCGAANEEATMRKQPARWVPTNPDAIQNGVRSFWISAFSSPWAPWRKICLDYLEALDDPSRLKVVFNTSLGRLWEERGEVPDEDALFQRREDYGRHADGEPIELPDGVLLLTCGVDVQDNRIEYEVVGHGKFWESWGIRRGFIMGRPDTDELWEKLDDVIRHVYRFKTGRGLRVSATFIDSGGHFTQEVYEQCARRRLFKVFPIKGKGGDGVPYINPPSAVPIRENKNNKVWLYTIGTDSGKAQIMNDLKKQTPGARYCHFPTAPEAGYDVNYFAGLVSEQLVPVKQKSGLVKWQWKIIPGHKRNEALDCRDYANAAARVLHVDFDAIERELNGRPAQRPAQARPAQRARQSMTSNDDW